MVPRLRFVAFWALSTDTVTRLGAHFGAGSVSSVRSRRKARLSAGLSGDQPTSRADLQNCAHCREARGGADARTRTANRPIKHHRRQDPGRSAHHARPAPESRLEKGDLRVRAVWTRKDRLGRCHGCHEWHATVAFDDMADDTPSTLDGPAMSASTSFVNRLVQGR